MIASMLRLSVTVRALLIAVLVLPSAGACSESGFTQKSESMLPTLKPGDHFYAKMDDFSPRRGMVLLILTPPNGDKRVYRLVGLPGDEIELKDGVPIINGQQARQTRKGPSQFIDLMGQGKAVLVEEQLPGEVGTHEILDDGAFPTDDISTFTVPDDKYFVMGDCRDRSADSRVPQEHNGIGLISSSKIFGKVQLDSINQSKTTIADIR